MSYKSKTDEALSCKIRQIIRREASGIRKRTEKDQSYTQSASIHRIRVGVKKMRALLRLVRNRFGDKSYHKQNAAWRAVGNRLGPLRNLQVQLKLLHKVCRRHSRQMSNEEFANLWKALLKERERHVVEVRASTTRLKIKLRAALDGTKRWPIKRLKERDLRCGIKRSHHRFLKAYEKAKKSPSIGNLHELRKRTKDLTYQLDMIKWLNAISIGKSLWKLTQLGKNLGDDHDLALLEINAAKFNPHVSKEFQRSVRFRRAELQQSAFELGRELSTIKPAVFGHLIKK